MARGKEVTSSQLIQKIADPSEQSGYRLEETTIYEPTEGTRRGVIKGKWGVCVLCGYTAPLVELQEIDGQYYCSKYKCYQSKIYELNREDL